MKYYRESDIRAFLKTKLQLRSQAEVARECDVAPQNVSVMANGGSNCGQGSELAWLQARVVEGLYERVNMKLAELHHFSLGELFLCL